MKKWFIGGAAALGLVAAGMVLAQVPTVFLTTLIGTEQIDMIVPATGTVVTNPRINSATVNTLAAFVQAGSGTAGTNGQVYLGVTGSAPKFSTMSQDCTITNAGVITCLKTNNVAFGTLAVANAVAPPALGGTTPAAASFTTLQNTTSAGLTVAVSTDATHTDATLCEDTTTHVVYFGSGTAGICLGTSSLRFKHEVAPLAAGLRQVLALEPISYKINADHGDPDHTLYGFSAEQGGSVLPHLMGKDVAGLPNTFDYLGVVPVLVKAIQEQQAQIDELKRQLARQPDTIPASMH